MARSRRPKAAAGAITVRDRILEPAANATLLDVLDKLLDKGVVVRGDVTLGLAGVDLIYLQLSSLLSAIDRIMRDPSGPRRSRKRHGPRRLRRP
jgi:hypothetical protein